MRDFIYSLLADPNPLNLDAVALHDLVAATQIRSSGGAAVGPTVAIPTPFIVIRDLSSASVFRGRARQGGVSIHVHDQPDSYVKIDSIMQAVSHIMSSVEPQWFGETWVMDVVDQGWSEDLYDDHYGTATRYGTYGTTASPIG